MKKIILISVLIAVQISLIRGEVVVLSDIVTNSYGKFNGDVLIPNPDYPQNSPFPHLIISDIDFTGQTISRVGKRTESESTVDLSVDPADNTFLMSWRLISEFSITYPKPPMAFFSTRIVGEVTNHIPTGSSLELTFRDLTDYQGSSSNETNYSKVSSSEYPIIGTITVNSGETGFDFSATSNFNEKIHTMMLNGTGNPKIGIYSNDPSVENYLEIELTVEFTYQLPTVTLLNVYGERISDNVTSLGGALDLHGYGVSYGELHYLNKNSNTPVPIYIDESYDYYATSRDTQLFNDYTPVYHNGWNKSYSPKQNSNAFKLYSSDMWVKANFKERPSISISQDDFYQLQLRDPWRISNPDAENPADWIQPNSFQSVSGSYDVFLNQNPNNYSNLPIYSLKAPRYYADTEHIYEFDEWQANPSTDADFFSTEDPTVYNVVFKDESVTVSPRYISINATANKTVSLAQDETLSIPAGANITFASGFTFEVSGTLNLLGTVTDTIKLTGAGTGSDAFIRLSNGGNNTTNPELSLNYCILNSLPTMIKSDDYVAYSVSMKNSIIENVNIVFDSGIMKNANIEFAKMKIRNSSHGLLFDPNVYDRNDQNSKMILHHCEFMNISGNSIRLPLQQNIVNKADPSTHFFAFHNNTFYNFGEIANWWDGLSSSYVLEIWNNIFHSGIISGSFTNGYCATNNLFYLTNQSFGNDRKLDDPLFINIEEYNLRLRPFSPAINSGLAFMLNWTLADDIFPNYVFYLNFNASGYTEDPDHTTPDIGAYYKHRKFIPQSPVYDWFKPYSWIIIDDDVIVPTRGLLNIGEGSLVEVLGGARLSVAEGGSLTVEGSASEPVIFRSDSAWYGIRLDEGCETDLQHLQIENAHYGLNVNGYRGDISHISVRNCNYGLYTYNYNGTLDGISADSCTYGIYVNGQSPVIKNSIFTNCEKGVSAVNNASPSLATSRLPGLNTTNNVFTGNLIAIANDRTSALNAGIHRTLFGTVYGGFNNLAGNSTLIHNTSSSYVRAEVNHWSLFNNYGNVDYSPTVQQATGLGLSKSSNEGSLPESHLAALDLELIGDNASAAAAYLALLSDSDEKPWLLRGLRRTTLNAGDTLTAIAALEMLSLPDAVDDGYRLGIIGELYTLQNRHPKALAAFEEGLARLNSLTSDESDSLASWLEFNRLMLPEQSFAKSSAETDFLVTYRLSEAARLYAELTGIELPNAPEILLPESYALYPAYPNPFNPVTTLSYDLPEKSDVTLAIFNIQGQEIHRQQWQNQPADFNQTRKMIYFK
jgi:hypothetical protein